METIREIIARRDGSTSDEIDDLFDAAVVDIADGVDPEEVIADVFGLEPDYLFDSEFMAAVEAGLVLRG